jgi:hypothetical protein
MNMTIKRNIYLLFFFCFSVEIFAQGLVENELTTNATLVNAFKSLQAKSLLKLGSIHDTLTLGTKGIVDDFSKPGPYPDTTFWITNKVFINNEYAKAPPTLGVATFDGLNYDGYPYDFSAPSGSSGVADSLISKPINLSFPASDSIYLSFFYQPQGIGNAPESSDSLVVYFKKPGTLSSWDRVWAKKGSTLAVNDSSWRVVMLPINNPLYLQKGFQFCIMNYATRSGNVDHWNIDYVYLNRLRHKADSVFEDVAFTYDIPSILNSYAQMPWRHYVTTETKSSVNTVVRNNHSVVKNVSFKHNLYDPSNIVIYTSPLSASNVDPFTTSGYYLYNAGSLPTIPLLTAPCDYTFEAIVNSTPDFHRTNDTMRHVQQFRYHYAYDDGTAESAFGLSTLNAKLAEKFTTTVDDTLRYIDIYFNPLMSNVTVYTFKLKIWADAGGYPGTQVYSSDSTFTPAYNHYGHNSFVRYPVLPPLYMNATTFHIGFQQNTNQFLNIGVDKNTNTQNMISYNVAGTWFHSPYVGSLMMRPVFGAASDFLVSDDIKNSTTKDYIIYPNPANDKLYIKTNEENTNRLINYQVYDLSGRIILSDRFYTSQSIDVSGLSEGIYFIQLIEKDKITTHKFVKVN